MRKKLWFWQVILLVALFGFWHVATHPELVPPFVWDNPNRAAFFFGEPVKILKDVYAWFAGGEIYPHLWVTLQGAAPGVSLVFFFAYFGVYQGVKEVSPFVLGNATMPGGDAPPAAGLRVPALGHRVGVL